MSQPVIPEMCPFHARPEPPWPTGRVSARAGTASLRRAARSAVAPLHCNAVAYRRDRGEFVNTAVPSGAHRIMRVKPAEVWR